jgi:APA family basic amino acid/polyamine antiporter
VGKPAENPKVFVREATGLVRSLSLFDAFSSNLAIINIASALTFPVLLIAYSFPQANIPLAVLLTVPPILLFNGVYSLFSRAMPRSGGDYVFISRTLSPALGFAANFSFAMWNMFWIGVYGNWTSTIGLSTLFYTLGLQAKSPSYISLGSALATPLAGFVSGFIMIVLVTLAAVWGIKKVITIQNLFVVVGFIGTVIGLGIVLASSHAQFVDAVDKVASYSQIVAAGSASGFSASQQTLRATVLSTGLVALTMLFGQFSVYTGGEIRRAGRNIPIAAISTTLVTAAFLVAGGFAVERVFGLEFAGGSQAAYYAGNPNYPFAVAPYFNFFSSLLAGNPVLIILIGLGFTLWTAAGGIFNLVTNSRCLLAWSFDRVFPTSFASVSERFHTPVNSIVLTSALAIVFLTLYSFLVSVVSFMAGTTLGYVFTFGSTAIAALVFPLRKSKKKMYEHSGADIKVLGVPLMILLGCGTLIYFGLLSYALITNSVFGVNSLPSLSAIAAFWVIGVLIFLFFKVYNRIKGIDPSYAFSEIPPE